MTQLRKAVKYIFPAIVGILIVGLVVDRIYRPETENPKPEVRIPAVEASEHIGTIAEVCGNVASADFASHVDGRPTFLNLGKAYPAQSFTAVIWESDRNKWRIPPEQLYKNREICIRGRIRLHNDSPQIIVSNPDQIRPQ